MIRTWMFELGIVAVVVLTISALSGGGVELIGALAVIASFAHGQVADRLAEAERERVGQALERSRRARVGMAELMDDVANHGVRVHCYSWAARYFTAKETLWFVYFVAHRSWSALAGVGLFLIYPAWRRWWRSHRRG